MQQKEIQRITNDKDVNPSLGYYVLASLMQKTPFNTVITTNFDNLIQDALIYSGNQRALVITHQDLAQFIKRDNTPLIVKIHGDAHLHPFNNKGDTKNIPEPLKESIQSLFTNAKVVCIGYRGDDESILDLLKGCKRIDQFYWLNNEEPKNVKLTKWWNDTKVKTFVKEYDFDKILNVMKSKFDIQSPDFNNIMKKLQNSYDNALQDEIKELQEINEEDKTELDFLLLGNTYVNQKEYKSSIQAYKKVIAINKKNDSAYYNMGNSYNNLEQYDEALKAYQKAIEINPKYDAAYNNQGITYANQQKYEEAIESYLKAIEINSKNDKAYNNLGSAYSNKGEYEKAIESYKKAIEINPKHADAYYNMGISYAKKAFL